MLRDRYDPQDLFTQIPPLCLQFEPVLAHLDRLLDDDELFRRLQADLACRHPQTLTRGRPSTPVEVILRMLVAKRLYSVSYQETEQLRVTRGRKLRVDSTVVETNIHHSTDGSLIADG